MKFGLDICKTYFIVTEWIATQRIHNTKQKYSTSGDGITVLEIFLIFPKFNYRTQENKRSWKSN